MAAWLAASLSGLLYGALFPPLAVAALSWIALAPLAWALRRASFGKALGLAALSTWIGAACVVPWLVPTVSGHFEMGLPFALAFWLWVSLATLPPFYAPILAVASRVGRRLPRSLWPLLFAAAWVVSEWLRTELGLRSPWTRLGDAQIEAARLRQIADLAGVYGLSFLLAFSAAVAAEAWDALATRSRTSRGVRRIGVQVAVLACLVAAALTYGETRVRGMHTGTALDVALVQGGLDPKLRWRRSHAGRVLRRYGRLTRDEILRSGRPAPDLIVWPEHAIQTQLDDPVYGPPLVRLAARSPLLIGAPRSEIASDGRLSFNSVHWIGAQGALGTYDKRRLLPFNETRALGGWLQLGPRGDLDAGDYTAGRAGAIFPIAGQQIAPLICMEALYPDLAREAARDGATVLAVVSNDGWFRGQGGMAQHAAMVRFRAIETRLPVIRATNTGVSAVIGPDGREVARLGAGESGVLRATVPEGAGASLYTRIGDAFVLGCGLVLGVSALVAWRRHGAQDSGSLRV